MFNKMARQNIQVLSDLCMPDIQDIVDILYAADLFDNECLFSQSKARSEFLIN